MSGARIHAGPVIFAAALLSLAGCGKKTAVRTPAPPRAARIGSTENGIASWYGIPYDGRMAASGEIFDMTKLTAAHRTLPFNTWVDVLNRDNGKNVQVRINDRGPFVDGRVIDLSQEAAREIGMLGPGIARVKLTVIPPPAISPVPSPSSSPAKANAEAPASAPVLNYAVQAGAFSDPARAESVRASLAASFDDVRVIESSSLWRVLVGHLQTPEAAQDIASKVRRTTGEAIVVPDR